MDWLNENFQWLKNDDPSRSARVMHGMQFGAQLAERRRTTDLQQRKFLADQEMAEREYNLKKESLDYRNRLHDLDLETKRQKAEGFSAIGETMAKWSGRYDDPEAEADFWQTARKFPAAMDDASFNSMATVFQRTRDYKSREDLLRATIGARGDEATRLELLKQEGRIALQGERLTKLQQMKADDQDFALELASFKHELGLQNPKGGSARFNLLDSDRVAYVDELKSLNDGFTMGLLKGANGKRATYDEYRKMAQDVVTKYEGRARTTPGAPAAAPTTPADTGKRVRVKSPDGKIGSIPESQLEEAKKNGFQLVP